MLKRRTIQLILIGFLLAGSLWLSGCTPFSTGESSQEFNWTAVAMVLVLLLLFYFMIMRPARKRQKEQQKLISTLKPGDQVIAAGGIYGVIESMDEESVIIRVESGAKLRVTKQGLMIKRSLG